MRMFLSIARIRLSEILQYRSSAISLGITQVVWGLMGVFILHTFSKSSVDSSISINKIISYIWLTRIFSGVFSPFSSTNLGEIIKSGSVSYELLRPIDFFKYWYSRVLAERLTKISYTVPFIAIIAFSLSDKYALHLPESLKMFIFFILSFSLSILIISAYELLFDLFSFYSISYKGVTRIMGDIFRLLSGSIIPIALMPGSFRRIVEFLPFASIVDTPFRIYSNYAVPENFGILLLKQCIWLALIVTVGYYMSQKAIKKVEIYGG